MPSALSKEEAEAIERRKNATLRKIYVAAFQSVTQHMIVLQSEPLLVRELCSGDIGRTAKLLANTTGLVGVLSIVLNQFGGKLSDAIGRKPVLLVGPLGNVILGLLVTTNAKNLPLLLICRIIRLMITTFSNTVILSAALADTVQGQELGMASAKIGAVVGLGIVLTPLLETALIRWHGHPRHLYKYLTFISLTQSISTILTMPETLQLEKRKTLESVMNLSTINPFGFMKLYTQGSTVLKKVANIVSLQMMLEGKNLSDIMEIWKSRHLGWTLEQSRNYIVTYGALSIFAGAGITPWMMKSFSIKGFTSVCNILNVIAFVLRGITTKTLVFLFATPFLLPGVNGSAARSLKAYATDLATQEGFGKGEFSAWLNNLRALISAFSTVLYGNYYNWCIANRVYAGTTFMVAAGIGAVIPELMLQSMKPEDFAA